MPLQAVNNTLDHILLVYKYSIVEYLGNDRFANILLETLIYLYNIKIKIISIFESTGLVHSIAGTKLKSLLEKSGFIVLSHQNNSLIFTKRDSSNVQCTLNYLYAPLAHLEILSLASLTTLRKSAQNKKKAKKHKGHFKIPPRKCVVQPHIASKLSISTPNLIVYIHPSLMQVLKAFGSPLSHRFDSLKSLLARFTALPNRYISPFGASGIPPWTLSEAEIYQIFSTSTSAIASCIGLYTNTVLRNGK